MTVNLLDAATSSQATGGGVGGTLMMVGYIAIIGIALYFLMIRPQRKKQKAEEKMRNDIQVGDEIITIGGFYGRIISMKEDTLTIESPVDRSKQTIAKWAIQQNLTVHDAAPDTKKVESKKESKKESK